MLRANGSVGGVLGMWRFWISVLAGLFSALSTATAQDIESRMQRCLELVQEQAPNTSIRKGWLGSCQAGTEAKAYATDSSDSEIRNVPIFPRIGSGDECSNPLGYTPAAKTSNCGKSSTFIKNYDEGIVRIPLSNGRCMFALPLLVTDKDQGFRCNAVRSRVACIRNIRTDGEDTIIKLGARASGPTSEGEIRIPSDTSQRTPLYAHRNGEPLFALLPAQITYGGDPKSVVNFITEEITKGEAKCRSNGNGQAHCAQEKAFHAERMVQEVLRRAWSPTSLVSEDDRKLDKDAFMAMVERHLGNDADLDTQALFKVIVENEIGKDSPYQVTDAVLGKSGPSWGAHQIDIGANDQPEIDLFWRAIEDNRPSNPNLDKALAMKACLSAPVRYYFTTQLRQFYESVAGMNDSLRTSPGKETYDARFKDWLKEGIDKAKKLKGLFKASPFARLYYLDVLNQFGAGKAQQLRVAGEGYSPSSLESCSTVKSGENRLVSTLISSTGYSPSDINRRVKHLHDFLREQRGQSEGRSGCH